MKDLEQGKQVLEVEAQCILAARDRLDSRFESAVQIVFDAIQHGGKVVLLGVGKSGKVAAKVAATLASTGTPALFLHPTEASHGDLGMVAAKDVMLIFSYSGTAEEILRLIPSLKTRGTKLISIVGNMKSTIAQHSDVALDGSVAKEACPLNLAPTSSTTVAMAIGDALALVLSTRLNFKEENFAVNHPGGALGRRLTLYVRDLMKKGDELPWVAETATIDEVINVSSEKKLGAVLVGNKKLMTGIITDGDIRRALKHKAKFFSFKASDVMTANPITIAADHKALEALELMENRSSQIGILPVVTADGSCVGLVRLHDLIGQL